MSVKAPAMTEAPPWTHPIAWSVTGTAERQIQLVADADVRARVARFLELEGVGRLEATLNARAWRDGMELDGRFVGLVTRLCGVSLETLEEAIDAPLRVRLVPSGSPHAPKEQAGEVVIDLEAEDPPDVVEGGLVDVGAYVVEALALALDPFPRKPGAVFEAPAQSEPPSPFAVLRNLPSK